MTSIGTKVTDPHAERREPTGAIASDSLAAESSRAGGAFSRNPNSEPQGVSGSNSTFANTNTSAATRLDPASDAEARMAQHDWAEEKKLGAAATSYPDAAGGQAKGLAVENTQGSYETGGASSHADTAPSYIASTQHLNTGKPKGKNLTEGGFDDDDRWNASLSSDIGTNNDPGRAAELNFEKVNANTTAASASTMPKQNRNTDTPYNVLSSEASA